MKELSVLNLLGINELTKSDIDLIFKTADSFKEVINRQIKKVPTLRDITIAEKYHYKDLPIPLFHFRPLKSFPEILHL